MDLTEQRHESGLHRTLARAILDLLRRDGAAAGTRLSEVDLASRLGVSRTPVRGALRLLSQAGIVAIGERRTVLQRLDGDIGAEADDPASALVARIAHDRVAKLLPDWVSEADLQRRYDAQRGVLTRALRRLAELGVIVRNRGHGWSFVPGIDSPEERAAAYRFRRVVEPAALSQPGYALPPGFAAEMGSRHQAFLERPFREFDPVAFFEMNAAFHLGIVAASGNRFFAQAAEQHNALRRLLNYDWYFGEERARTSCREHLAILAALEAGDQARASDLLARHLDSAAALPDRQLSERGQGHRAHAS